MKKLIIIPLLFLFFSSFSQVHVESIPWFFTKYINLGRYTTFPLTPVRGTMAYYLDTFCIYNGVIWERLGSGISGSDSISTKNHKLTKATNIYSYYTAANSANSMIFGLSPTRANVGTTSNLSLSILTNNGLKAKFDSASSSLRFMNASSGYALTNGLKVGLNINGIGSVNQLGTHSFDILTNNFTKLRIDSVNKINFYDSVGVLTGSIKNKGSNFIQGINAAKVLTNGVYNQIIGEEAGLYNTTASYNVNIGYKSGYLNKTTSGQVFIGYNSGYSHVTTDFNVFIGHRSGENNISGNNTFIGSFSGFSNTTGNFNVHLGERSGYENSTGINNVFVGTNCGYKIKGSYNVIVGGTAAQLATGNSNTIIGGYAGNKLTRGYLNTYLGDSTGTDNAQKVDAVNVTLLGAKCYSTLDNSIILGNTSITTTGLGIYTPTARFHQDAGNATNNYHKLTSGTTTGLTATDGVDYGIGGDGVARIKQWENHSLKVYTNNTLAMTIDSVQKTTLEGDLKYAFKHAVGSADSIAYTSSGSTQNIYYKLATGAMVWREQVGIKCQGDSAQILTAGDYKIHIWIAVASGNTNDKLRVKLYINNNQSATNLGRFTIQSQTATNADTKYYMWYKTFAANDWLSWRIANIIGSRATVTQDLKIYIEKVPE
jgi:hypothetical protein